MSNFDRFQIGDPERDDHFIIIDDENRFAPLPERCAGWSCLGAVLEKDAKGFWYCPKCGEEYGKAE